MCDIQSRSFRRHWSCDNKKEDEEQLQAEQKPRRRSYQQEKPKMEQERIEMDDTPKFELPKCQIILSKERPKQMHHSQSICQPVKLVSVLTRK